MDEGRRCGASRPSTTARTRAPTRSLASASRRYASRIVAKVHAPLSTLAQAASHALALPPTKSERRASASCCSSTPFAASTARYSASAAATAANEFSPAPAAASAAASFAAMIAFSASRNSEISGIAARLPFKLPD